MIIQILTTMDIEVLRNKACRARSNRCLALGFIVLLPELQSKSPGISTYCWELLTNMSIKETSSGGVRKEVLISVAIAEIGEETQLPRPDVTTFMLCRAKTKA